MDKKKECTKKESKNRKERDEKRIKKTIRWNGQKQSFKNKACILGKNQLKKIQATAKKKVNVIRLLT